MENDWNEPANDDFTHGVSDREDSKVNTQVSSEDSWYEQTKGTRTGFFYFP